MTEKYVRTWGRHGLSHRYVNDYLIAEAKLTAEQTSVIEIYLKSRKLQYEQERTELRKKLNELDLQLQEMNHAVSSVGC